MPNFTSEVKRDLLRNVPETRCCRLALLAAFLDTGGSTDGKILFTSEKEEIAEYFLSVIEEAFGISMTVAEAVRDPKYGRNKLTFIYTGTDRGKIADEIANHSARNIVGRACCVRAYLKGAFLGGGSCTLPHGGVKTGYHLEFVFKEQGDAENFCELLDVVQLIGSIVKRGEKFVVYLKSREAISDFLSVVGAFGALKKLEEVSAEREENNNYNRVSNCYAGNADKSAIASAVQTKALEEMEQAGILATLPKPLEDTARARMNNPTLSLAELSAMLGVSKSCLNHRLRKLMQIHADEK